MFELGIKKLKDLLETTIRTDESLTRLKFLVLIAKRAANGRPEKEGIIQHLVESAGVNTAELAL